MIFGLIIIKIIEITNNIKIIIKYIFFKSMIIYSFLYSITIDEINNTTLININIIQSIKIINSMLQELIE